MKPVIQLNKCLICDNRIEPQGYNKCRRCGNICDLITHDELPNTDEPILTFVDFKSKCCNDDVDIISRSTCSDECHEIYMQALERQFGEFKKITDATTGITHKVPTRVIAEEGLKQQDLYKFPILKEEE